jgi:uncharacterized protein (TIGR03118 family)
VECLEDRNQPSGFVQTALMSDVPALAANHNPNFVNSWQFVETSDGQFWVALNGTGQAIQIDAGGQKHGADIIIPPPAGSPKHTVSAPTGVVANTTSDFVISSKGRSAPATLIFDSEDGTITAWNDTVNHKRAVLANDQSGTGAVYKGLAMGSVDAANYLYATDFHNGTIAVFDKSFQLVTLGTNGFGTFTDPSAPPPAVGQPGFAPFGIANFGGTLFVTYALQNSEQHDDVAGAGNGFIDEFDTSGHFIQRLVTGTAVGGTVSQLNSPFGMTMAPAGFGNFGGDLLVGNFGDSHVSAFNPADGTFVDQLRDTQGNPLVLNGGFQESDTKGLWGIGFGNGAHGTSTTSLYFAAGINDEGDGVFGRVDNAPNSGPTMVPRDDVQHHLADVLENGLALTAALHSMNLNTIVTADVNTLAADLATVIAESSTGSISTSDLNAASAAADKLTADLGTNVPPDIANLLADLHDDLGDLSSELAPSKV